MRTVEQIQFDYGEKGYLNHRPININWSLAISLEKNRFIVQECFSSGMIRCKLPDWYLLKPDSYELISDLIISIGNIEYLKIGKYSFYIKQKRI